MQRLLTYCEIKGKITGLKFNDTKTQFIVSGNCPINDPFLVINGKKVYPQSTLKHLGFFWDVRSKKISLTKHQENRISELWAVTSSLISSGIRKMHPNIIANIFKSIVLPKVLYGLEITTTTKTFLELMNRQCRSAFKSLLGYSKHGSNDLNRLYHVADIVPYIENRKLNLLTQLMKNDQTSNYLLHTLASNDRQYSIIPGILEICLKENLNVVDMLLNVQKSFKVSNVGSGPLDKIDPVVMDKLKFLIANWSLYECRSEIRDIINRKLYLTI